MSANNKRGPEPGGSGQDALLGVPSSKLPFSSRTLLSTHPRWLTHPLPIIKFVSKPAPLLPILSSPAKKKPKLEPNTESRQTAKTNNKSKKKPPEEAARLKSLVGDMRSMVECPVCLHLPRRGPIPACPNGHIICLACKKKITERAREAGTEAICPTCNGPLGNHTSLLAAKLLEGVAHECKFTGCDQEMTLEDLEQHENICQYQLVSCPFDKDHKLSLFDLRNHSTTMGCEGVEREADLAVKEFELSELQIFSRGVTKDEKVGTPHVYGTDILLKRKTGQVFYFKSEIVAGNMHRFEIVTEGTEEECKKTKVHIDIRDSADQPILTLTTHPRPLSMDHWGDFCLWIPETSLAKIWKQGAAPKEFYYKVGIQIA